MFIFTTEPGEDGYDEELYWFLMDKISELSKCKKPVCEILTDLKNIFKHDIINESFLISCIINCVYDDNYELLMYLYKESGDMKYYTGGDDSINYHLYNIIDDDIAFNIQEEEIYLLLSYYYDAKECFNGLMKEFNFDKNRFIIEAVKLLKKDKERNINIRCDNCLVLSMCDELCNDFISTNI